MRNIKNKQKICVITYMAISLVSALMLNFGSQQTVKAACNTADACERAAETCRVDGGTWDSAAGTCKASQRAKCEDSGGRYVELKSNQQGAVDGVVYRCVCDSPLTNQDGVCVQEEGSDSTGGRNIQRAEGPDTDCDASNGDLDESNCGIIGLLNTVFNFVSGGIALAVIGNIIYAGIQYSMAQGDPSAVSKSKNRIRGALIAFIMYLSLYAFIQWLIPGGVFG